MINKILRKFIKDKINIFYLALLCLSATFIVLYFIKTVDTNVRNLLMSIAASLIGAIIIGLVLECTAIIKKINKTDDILCNLKNACIGTLKEVNDLFENLKTDVTFDFKKSTIEEFIVNSVQQYLDLRTKNTVLSNKKADDLKHTIDNYIFDSFIVDHCKLVIHELKIILDSSVELLKDEYFNKEDFKLFRKAHAKLVTFVNQIDNPTFTILNSANLNFVQCLKEIIDLEK